MMYQWLLVVIALVFSAPVFSYERVVLLAPAAGDIMIKLGLKDKVVGVTRSSHDFPNALKVGSHIKPNAELIKSLHPDLIIIGNERFFNHQLQRLLKTKILSYQPHTLKQIQQGISELGSAFEVETKAKELNQQLDKTLAQIKPLALPPKVLYEVTEMPLIIAGHGNIVADIIKKAGGTLLAPQDRTLIKYNVESVITSQPDIYLYQKGPMNRNPSKPETRPQYHRLTMESMQVDQLKYSRANSQSFALALKLNRYFMSLQK